MGVYNGWTINTNYTRLTKSNGMATLQGLFIPATNTAIDVPILSVPVGFRPVNKSVPINLSTSLSNSAYSARIEPSGDIKLFTAISGSVVPWVGINATWCAE